MKRLRLTTQLNLIFTVVTLTTAILFLIIFQLSLTKLFEQQNITQLNNYTQEIAAKKIEEHNNGVPTLITPDNNNGFIIYKIKGKTIVQEDVARLDTKITDSAPIILENETHYFEKEIQRLLSRTNYDETSFQTSVKLSKTIYISGFITPYDKTTNLLIVGITDSRYTKGLKSIFLYTVEIAFLILMIFGNLLILMWARLLVGRIEVLNNRVLSLPKTDYKNPIQIEGRDELTKLAQSIETMREEIKLNEDTKQQMLHNISHDLKTPIAVILSYAEAIKDGISDTNEASEIIIQANKINRKISQLLHLNRLEYLKDASNFTNVKVKNVIERIVTNYKYKFSNIQTKLDNSIYFCIEDNLEIAIANIIDNAVRYVRSVIKIELKNKKLTIYNDGENIEKDVIKHIFSPYEKGNKGNFGLGMSISKTTFNHFKLDLKVENTKDGVLFTIEPF